jgi:hypothetical protein
MLANCPSFALILFACFLAGCKEEKPTVYSERVAVLPDKSGLLIKEIREVTKTETEMVLKEVVGSQTREIFVVPLTGFPDVRFRFKVGGDTVYLAHTQPDFEKAIQSVAKPTFPIRTEHLSSTEWLTAGTAEGDPIFYSEEKWGALLELMRRN